MTSKMFIDKKDMSFKGSYENEMELMKLTHKDMNKKIK